MLFGYTKRGDPDRIPSFFASAGLRYIAGVPICYLFFDMRASGNLITQIFIERLSSESMAD